MLQRMQPLRDKDLQRLSARKHRLEEAEAKDGRKRKAEVSGNGGHGGHGLNAWDAGAKLVGLGFGVFFFLDPTSVGGLNSISMFSCHQSFTSTVASTKDVSFYADLLKREELHLDDEKLKEFFPLEGTIDRILEVFCQ